MRRIRPYLCGVIACAAVQLGLPGSTHAAVVVATDNQLGTGGTSNFIPTYDPINTTNDVLLKTTVGTSVTAGAGSFTTETSGGVPIVNDGAFGSINSGNTGAHPSFATVGNGAGTSLTFNFNPSKLTSIVVYGGWNDNGRDEQKYSIAYSTNGGTSYTALIQEDFNPVIAGSIQSAIKITFTDDTGFIGGGAAINALQFTFPGTGTVENNYAGLAEIAAYGTPAAVPEPTTLAVAGVGLTGLALRRRRPATA